MKPTIIPHPLKRIHFNYHSEAALTDFETAFIYRYKQLHDELATIKNELLQLSPTIRTVGAGLKEVVIVFEKLRLIITRTERIFGLATAGSSQKDVQCIRSGEIQRALDAFQAARAAYWEVMLPMHNQFNAVFQKFTAFDDSVEAFEKEYSGPLQDNAASMQIDIRCFDQDMNEFRAEWMGVAHLQDECLDQYSEWVKGQTKLMTDCDELYERIRKVFQHINAIQDFTSRSSGNDFGLN